MVPDHIHRCRYEQITQQSLRVALCGLSTTLHYPGIDWSCLLPPAHPGETATMKAEKAPGLPRSELGQGEV